MRKFLLVALVVLVVCTLGFAQITRDSAMQQFTKAQVTGKPQLVMPTAAPGTHTKSMAMFNGQKLSVKSTIKPANAPGEPWFCDWNNGQQVLVCPKGVQTAYGTAFPSANGGAGMTVAIVDYFFYNWIESALAQYNADMHLPPCTVANGCLTLIDMSNGWECDYCYGWEVETMLDIEAVHAMAPNAKIVFIGGDPFNYGTAEETAAQALGNVTSNSWTFNAGESVDPIFGPFLGQGPPTLFASGDGGWFPSQGIAYPCTSTKAVCVGGTSLYLNPNLTRNAETAWSGAGGGCSASFAIPSWQNYPIGSTICSPNRAAPDIAAIADPNTGFATYIGGPYYSGFYYGVGGTSLATPINAGLIADIDAARVAFGKPLLTFANFNSEMYAAANYNYNYYVFDVTAGSNGYPAGPKFDLVTGLGVPNGKNIGSRFFGIP
jgi:subtilase family serine protease